MINLADTSSDEDLHHPHRGHFETPFGVAPRPQLQPRGLFDREGGRGQEGAAAAAADSPSSRRRTKGKLMISHNILCGFFFWNSFGTCEYFHRVEIK